MGKHTLDYAEVEMLKWMRSRFEHLQDMGIELESFKFLYGLIDKYLPPPTVGNFEGDTKIEPGMWKMYYVEGEERPDLDDVRRREREDNYPRF